jgi:hypothetical protein
MSNLNAEDQELLKGLIVIVKALELTVLESPHSDEYLKNKEIWSKRMNAIVGEAYLRNLFSKPDEPPYGVYE